MLILCKCGSDQVKTLYNSSTNTSDGLQCFERCECQECGCTWDDEIDCPEADNDEPA